MQQRVTYNLTQENTQLDREWYLEKKNNYTSIGNNHGSSNHGATYKFC